MRPKFSVVCIAKNEAKTLPRLLSSLNEFKVRGGEIIVIDTGSSDSTVKTALDLGCTVFEEGARFIKTISAFDAERINEKFVHSSEDAVVHTGDKLFDFSAARNYAATQASNDWVCMIDCDEVLTTLDLDALDKILDTPKLSRIEFEFVYAHDQFDRPLIQFRMSRFYHRRKVYWNPKCIVHEILTPVEGADTGTFYVGENILKSDHYQNQETSRSGYLTGLALDCYLNPENDRNSHYFGRELFYRGRYRSAITEFQRHVAMNGWGVERAQSMVYIGDCFKALGNEEEALAWWNKAFLADGTRREPLMRLAWFFYGKDDKHKTAAYASAAMALPRVGCYMDNESQYRQEPCELLYWALWYLGDKEGSAVHWRKAVGYQPLNSKYLNDGQFYVNPGLGLEAFKKALIERQPFSFVKLGDGERACMAGETGANCDGQPYSTALALALKQAYEFLVGKVHVVDFSNQNSFNLLLHRTGNNLAEVKSFWRTIIDLPSRKVFVGPARLRPVADLLKASFVEVPVENAFSEYEEIKTRMGYYYKRGSVFIFSAGMTAKLIIADLLKWCADITCIDA
jgi:glycosyltransferase involved in cell wall biosynthesis